MVKDLCCKNIAAEERRLSHQESEQGVDMAALYDKTAEQWVRDEPRLRDDLISWPLLVSLTKQYGENRIILDCGCGSGNVCRLVSPFAKTVIGIDISKRMLEEAERHSAPPANIVYLRGDMVQLAKHVPPSSVDLCISIFGCCCVRNLEELVQTFKQMRKVVRVGGASLIQIPHPLESFFTEKSSWVSDIDLPGNYFESGKVIRRKLKTTDGAWLLVARHHFTISNYTDAMSGAGFRIAQVIEPRPSSEVLRTYPTLAREAKLPSSIIFILEG
jgi:ubiquinone/menaquinone biosynthesis C-methylase UbiE